MRKISTIIFLLALFFSTSCNKDEIKEENPEISGPTIETDGERITLRNGTLLFSQEQIGYIDSVSADTILMFNRKTPQHLLPQVGTIVVQLERIPNIPDGFVGRITDIHSQNEGYRVTTETIPLEDAFSEIKLEGTVDLVPVDIATRGISLEMDEDGFLAFPYTFKNMPEGLSLECRLGIKLIHSGDLVKGDFHCIILTKVGSTIGLELESKTGISPFENFDGIAIPLTPPGTPVTRIFTPNLILKPYFSIEGGLTLNAEYNYSKVYVADCVQNGKQWSQGSYQWPEDKNHNELTVNEMSIKGNMEAGLGLGLELRVLNSKSVKISDVLAGKLIGEGGFDLSENPTNAYELLKDARLDKHFLLENECIVTVGPLEIPVLNVEKPLWEESYYILPEIENISANVEKNTAVISTQIKRNLLFQDTKIGIGLWDDLGDAFQQSKLVSYYRENTFPSPWQVAFTDLPPGYFRAYPYIQLPMFPNHPIIIPEFAEGTIGTSTDPVIGTWEGVIDGEKIRAECLPNNMFYAYDAPLGEPSIEWNFRSKGRWSRVGNEVKIILENDTEVYTIENVSEDFATVNFADYDVRIDMKRLKYVGTWEMVKYYYQEIDASGKILYEEVVTDPTDEEWFNVAFRANNTFRQSDTSDVDRNQGSYYVEDERLYWEPFMASKNVYTISNPNINEMLIEFKEPVAIEQNRFYLMSFYFNRKQ